jgi:hypothetical protein
MRLIRLLVFVALWIWLPAQAESLCKASDNLSCEGEYVELGVLANGITVTNYTYIFGEAQRAALRVIFESKGEYLGMYATSSPGTTIEGNCVIFAGENPDEGDRLCLEAGSLPQQVWIGGEVYHLFY